MAELPEQHLGTLLSTSIQRGIQDAVGSVIGGMSELTGEAPLGGEGRKETIGASIAQAVFDVTANVLKNEPGSDGAFDVFAKGLILPGLLQLQPYMDHRAWVRVYGAASEGNYIAMLQQLGEGLVVPKVTEWLEVGKAEGGISGEALWSRALATYGAAASVGVAAHAISGLLSTRILGSGGLNLGGLAALVSEFAGFGPLVNSIVGNFYWSFLNQPMRYYFGELFTPMMPGPMDIMRFRYKRILGDQVRPDAGPLEVMQGTTGPGSAGYDRFKELMAKHGFSAEWAETWENDLYTEPRHFELSIMGENDNIPERWWWTKSRRMGYSEEDVAFMVGGIKNKLIRTWRDGAVNEEIRNYGRGYITEERFQQSLADARLFPRSAELAQWIGETRLWRGEIEAEVQVLMDDFRRDRITLEELDDLLAPLIVNDSIRERMVYRAELRKYRNIYWQTPTDEAKAAVKYYRKLYVAGVLTTAEYDAYLLDAGFEGRAADAMIEYDDHRRNEALARRFQTYGLPALRDRFLHGEILEVAYRSLLLEGGFPQEYLDAELALLVAKKQARVTATVRRGELPHYRTAFVLGLIGGEDLRDVMGRAGLASGEIQATFTTLSRQRLEIQEREEAAALAEQEAADAEATRAAERIVRELEQARARARGLTTTWARERSEEARGQCASLAEQLISEVRRGTNARLDQLRAYSDALEAALWWAQVSAA